MLDPETREFHSYSPGVVRRSHAAARQVLPLIVWSVAVAAAVYVYLMIENYLLLIN